jgi:hypothetical protein
MEYAAKALAFITEQIEAGKTVYIQTATHTGNLQKVDRKRPPAFQGDSRRAADGQRQQIQPDHQRHPGDLPNFGAVETSGLETAQRRKKP